MLKLIKENLWDIPFKMLHEKKGRNKYLFMIELFIAYLFLSICCFVFIIFAFLILNNIGVNKQSEKIKIIRKENEEKRFNHEKKNLYLVLQKNDMMSEIKVSNQIYSQYKINDYIQVKYHYGRFNHKFYVDEVIN